MKSIFATGGGDCPHRDRVWAAGESWAVGVRGDLAQHVDIERLVGNDRLEALVFGPELFLPLGIGCLHRTVDVLPASPGGFGDSEGAGHLSDGRSLVEHLVVLDNLSDHLFHLFGCMAP